MVSVIYCTISHKCRFFLKESERLVSDTRGVFTDAPDAPDVRWCSCSVFGIINEFRNMLCGRALSAGSTLEMFSREELKILYVVCPSRVAVPVCP